ncbi:pentapeptide repeat-containing protein [Sinomonas gamaensis]|uniref:pentapeptide repeat-containing protein n=1 Tax=Sinomonas gamaensis TaxID=2565624 RepID=UPI001109DE34|nr:pentapeptide repeat-containing protein [Sinomonas gamaensis]
MGRSEKRLKKALRPQIGAIRSLSFSRSSQEISLFTAVLTTVLLSLVVAALAYILIRVLAPVDVSKKLDPQYAIQYALWIAGGVGGVVALVVAYRRQKVIEGSLFVERFGAAAAQLGSDDSAVRLAGAYAMAGVADEGTPTQRQQCVNVLCAYLRLPYAPEDDASGLTQRVLKKAPNAGRPEEETTLRYRLHDKEVRQTIIRILASHLRPEAAVSWSACDLDFSGALLQDPRFSNCDFSGKRISFDGTTFLGEVTSFDHANLSGEATSFVGATFSADTTSFVEATFSGREVRFDNATFSGKMTVFGGASFSGVWAMFGAATFSADRTVFYRAAFSGGIAAFQGATFSGKLTAFDDATFSAGMTRFAEATFSADLTSFVRTTFSGREATFGGTTFSAGSTTFKEAKLCSEEGGTLVFRGTKFVSAVSFRDANFGPGIVDFTAPRHWDPAPSFDWDEDDDAVKPSYVLPEAWPPVVDLEGTDGHAATAL